MIVNSLVVQPWTLRLGPVVLVRVVLRRPSSVRREAVVDELPREVGPRRGASRGEEAWTGVARRRKRRRHRGRRGTRHRRAHGVVRSSGALRGDPEERRRIRRMIARGGILSLWASVPHCGIPLAIVPLCVYIRNTPVPCLAGLRSFAQKKTHTVGKTRFFFVHKQTTSL